MRGKYKMIFAKRYEELIGTGAMDNDFCGGVNHRIKEKLVALMMLFAQPKIFHPDRYNANIEKILASFVKDKASLTEL